MLKQFAVMGLVLVSLTSCWQKVVDIECEGDDLSRCLGQTVMLEGQVVVKNPESAGVMQHPVMTGPDGGYQSYLEYTEEYGQVVLVSKSPLTCNNRIKLKGRLERVSIECQPGQQGKCPYGGYFVYVQDHECQ